jgi:hypothetical protein
VRIRSAAGGRCYYHNLSLPAYITQQDDAKSKTMFAKTRTQLPVYGPGKRLQWPTSQGGFVSVSHIGYEGSEPMVIAEEAGKETK